MSVASHPMRVRIGFGLGTQGLRDLTASFPVLVDALEREGFDSLWLSERLSSPAPDPVAAAAFAVGRTTRLKVGFSVLVLPGRNPAVLAGELATVDVLSGGRLLPAVGLGAVEPGRTEALGVSRVERSGWVEEALPLMRRFWTEESVDHDGPRFPCLGARVRPKPVQDPLDVWLGGRAPGELRRVGRLGDGWLPSFCTPAEVQAGRAVVEEAAAAAGRTIDPEHWGALIPYSHVPLPDVAVTRIERRVTGVDVAATVPVGLPTLRGHIEAFLEVGFSKFVVVPIFEPDDWDDEVGETADAVLRLQD